MLGMRSKDQDGEAPAKKMTGVMTNSPMLVEKLREFQCSNEHRHVMLTNGRAQKCQIYPDEFCRLVCKTVMREKNLNEFKAINMLSETVRDQNITDVTKEVNALMALEMKTPHEDMYEEFDFVDDVTGRPLNHKLAAEARRLEIDFFKNMKVYEKVPRWRATEAGGKVVTTRWIDINKGDLQNPNYRARLVGREMKMDKRLDLFAATPPLESLRMMCSLCASNQWRKDPYRILSIDIKRAYFYAPASRPVFIEIPVEDYEAGDEERVGKLNLSLYGTRDAAQNWAKEYTAFLRSLGLLPGGGSPCNFVHKAHEVHVTVHGDDFTATGPMRGLDWFNKEMGAKYEIKAEFLGPDAGQSTEIRVLNRVLRWTEAGVEYEPDQRHAEIIMKSMEVQNSKPLTTPGTNEDKDVVSIRAKSKALTGKAATEYRALAARLNYLALDRIDLQYVAKCVSKYMSSPCEHDWLALKKVAKYLVGRPRFVQLFQWQTVPSGLTAFSDSDWAGDRETRKSTSGGMVMFGAHLLKSWSSTQQVIALSSGEAELYALIKATAQAKGIVSNFFDFGYKLSCTVCTDASAAIGIVHRVGLGRTRHIDVQFLWIQGEVQNKAVRVIKVGTADNPADVLTKNLSAEVMTKHMRAIKCRADAGRADKAPQLNEMKKNDDYWEVGDGWTRRHAKPRVALFTPMKVAGGPQNGLAVGEIRVTLGHYADGQTFSRADLWKELKDAHSLRAKPWTGCTTFITTGEFKERFRDA